MKINNILLILLMSFILSSCFEEDVALPSYVSPYNVIALENSIYTHQTYVDLGSDTCIVIVENPEWALSFDCSPDGYQVRVNSSAFWGIAATGATKIDAVYSDSESYVWLADHPDGNPDSTAVGEWVGMKNGLPEYSMQVYLIGKYDGIDFKAYKKVQFFYVDEHEYKFYVGDLESSDIQTVVVSKNDNYNYVQYAVESNEVLHLEPLKDEWDLLFCQYQTTLFTDDGIATSYYVRGTLLNPNGVLSVLDTLHTFEEIDYNISISMEFSSKQDAIGHDWKSVSVDQSTNSAEYKVRPEQTYIVKDTDNQYYKLRFTDYFSSSGIKGYPSFEFALLEPGNK